MGKKMAGTNEFALFRCKSICTGGGVQNQAETKKKIEKCLPAGTGTKIYFSSFPACFCSFSHFGALFVLGLYKVLWPSVQAVLQGVPFRGVQALR